MNTNLIKPLAIAGGVSVSIGIEEYDPRKHCRINDVIHEADMLMYKAKRNKTKTEFGWKRVS